MESTGLVLETEEETEQNGAVLVYIHPFLPSEAMQRRNKVRGREQHPSHAPPLLSASRTYIISDEGTLTHA